MAKARFTFKNKEDEDYNPYGSRFTERQLKIINGIPVENLRTTEITIVMRKAEKLGWPEIAEQVWDLYEDEIMGTDFKFKYTLEEAKEVLQKLTPRKIEW